MQDAIKVAMIQNAKLIESVESEEARCMARGLDANSRLSGFVLDTDLNFPEWMPALEVVRATVPLFFTGCYVG